VDDHGNLAVLSASDVGTGNTYFRADGSSAAVVMNGANEQQGAARARESGFLVLTHSFKQPWCTFLRSLSSDALPGSASVVASDPTFLSTLVRNPLGGHVEARTRNENAMTDDFRSTLQLRWLNDDLQPIGNWQTAIILNGLRQNWYWRVFVDQRGRALVLSTIFPITLGAPLQRSDWKFGARWMGPDGPLSDVFEPITPMYTSPDGAAYFANWGTVLPLREGGFAMFHAPAPSGSGVPMSPSGWYASYSSVPWWSPSNFAASATVLDRTWLEPYDGSLQLVAGGKAYAAAVQDPNTCRRTVLLIAPSGRTCFRLAVEGSDLCGWTGAISGDGTLVLQKDCEMRWWPGLARPGQSQ
jgi:hypothetical protein